MECRRLRSELNALEGKEWRGAPALDRLVKRGEIEVLIRAVELAVEQGLFYDTPDLSRADRLLQTANARVERAKAGVTHCQLLVPETRNAPSATVGGFVSKLDGSVQPYGLVVPAGWESPDQTPRRLDIWLHGRGEKVMELQFLDQRLHQVGPITPEGTFVLHPYGRYSNAFKFAGEVDVLEAIEHIARHFPIDRQRISIRGFSMGGAGCWQLAVHRPGDWFGANPGAGFCETLEFLREFQGENFIPSAAQQRLLHLYDSPDWSRNLRSLPLIAYSGEADKQKQAADKMESAMAERGLKLQHRIGPKMGHKIDSESADIMEAFMASLPPHNPVPATIDFTTYTLRYPKNAWVTINGMREHWSEARVQAELLPPHRIRLRTEGITQLRIDFNPGECPLQSSVEFDVDGEVFQGPEVASDRSLHCELLREEGSWSELEGTDERLRKRPGLQGPIDDAFMDPFLFVRPSRPCWHGVVERWVAAEFKHATEQWRKHFRGDVRIVLDTEITDEQIRNHNLILFGDPTANQFLARIAHQLPVRWNSRELGIGDHSASSDEHAVAMIFPNPLRPDRYVVLNSGFTFREYAYLNNARQIPMLPDWAILNVSKGANYQMPGQVFAEGFFDEQWRINKK
jgi:predicted esterase